MDGRGPSRTAWSAACHRGAHQVLEDGRIFRDPLGLPLLEPFAEQAVEDARSQPDRAPMRILEGVDLTAPISFLWLGVVPYLTREAVDATLRVVAAVPDGRVAFDHANPVSQLDPRRRAAHEARAERVRAIGEPWLTSFDTDELADHLATLGLAVTEDVGATEIGRRWLGRPLDAPAPGGGGHVVVAAARRP